MLILLTAIVEIMFFYAQQGERYESFGKVKKIISYTAFLVGLIGVCFAIVSSNMSSREMMKCVLGGSCIASPVLFTALCTQRNLNSKMMKGTNENDNKL